MFDALQDVFGGDDAGEDVEGGVGGVVEDGLADARKRQGGQFVKLFA